MPYVFIYPKRLRPNERINFETVDEDRGGGIDDDDDDNDAVVGASLLVGIETDGTHSDRQTRANANGRGHFDDFWQRRPWQVGAWEQY